MPAKLVSRLPEIAASLKPRVDAVVRVGAEMVAEHAKERVPIGQPDVHLRDAIHSEKGGGGYYVIAGDDDAFYGHMVEFGTSHSAPRPFLVPSLEADRDTIVAEVAGAIRAL